MTRVEAAKRRNRIILLVVLIIVAAIVIASAVFLKRAGEYGYEQYNKMMYPLTYSEYVEKYAEEYDVDKYLVYAVIKTESSFRPESESNVGARGLMQLMSDTFDWINFYIGDSAEDTFDDMYKPEKNIRYGTYLLNYLLTYFENRDCAIAAYHAGAGSVSGWLEDPEYTDDGVTLKRIPISDTAHYVNKINNAYDTYIELYENENGGNEND